MKKFEVGVWYRAVRTYGDMVIAGKSYQCVEIRVQPFSRSPTAETPIFLVEKGIRTSSLGVIYSMDSAVSISVEDDMKKAASEWAEALGIKL